MRILLSGGGSAGHINPAIAIAESILLHNKEAKIAFVGTENGMENKLIKEAGYPMYPITVQGFSRSISPKNLLALYYAVTSPYQAKRILRDFSPDIVIGTGGYVCWPILRAASLCSIPCALHESNACPGLTTKQLADKMDAVWLNFEGTKRYLSKKALSHTKQTGNPLRGGFFCPDRLSARKALGLAEKDVCILSFGGSLGAEDLNRAVVKSATELLKVNENLRWFHGTGERHFATWQGALKNPRFTVLPYIREMPTYMTAADIVIARAGAITLSELALCGKCALLVPSPFVADNHQYKNAALLKNENAAFLVENRTLDTELTPALQTLLSLPERRMAAAKNIRRFAFPRANAVIYEEICRLLKSKEKSHKKC